MLPITLVNNYQKPIYLHKSMSEQQPQFFFKETPKGRINLETQSILASSIAEPIQVR